jgi:hypothetical protein
MEQAPIIIEDILMVKYMELSDRSTDAHIC